MNVSDWQALKDASGSLLNPAGDARLIDNYYFDCSDPCSEFYKLISMIECSFLQRFLIAVQAMPESEKKTYNDQETGFKSIFKKVTDFKVLTNAVELLSQIVGEGSNPTGTPISESLESMSNDLSNIKTEMENLSSIKENTDLLPTIKEQTNLIGEIQTNTNHLSTIEETINDLPHSVAATIEADVGDYSKGLHDEFLKMTDDYRDRVTSDLDAHLKSMVDARDTVVGYYRDLKADIVQSNESLAKLFKDLSAIKDEITLKQNDQIMITSQTKQALEIAQHINGIIDNTVNDLTLLYNRALGKVTDAAAIDIEMTQMYKSLEVYTDKISSAQDLVIKSLDAVNQLAGVSGNLNQATAEILKSSGSIKEMQAVIDQVAENTQKNVQILSDVMTRINESSVKAIETFNNNLITLSTNFLKFKEIEDANDRSDKRIDQVIEGVKALTDVADSINGANGVNARNTANVIESRKWH